jgi:hypothetical protein
VESHRLISVAFAEDGIAEGGRVQESEWESENMRDAWKTENSVTEVQYRRERVPTCASSSFQHLFCCNVLYIRYSNSKKISIHQSIISLPQVSTELDALLTLLNILILSPIFTLLTLTFRITQ